MERKEITIFTDGSCYWKIKKGGIGVYMICDGEETFISKGYKKTTIGRCEMRALLTAIQSLRKDIPISATVYSDSQKEFDYNRFLCQDDIRYADIMSVLKKKIALKRQRDYVEIFKYSQQIISLVSNENHLK